MNSNGCHDCVSFHIDHTDVVRARIHNVNFVLSIVGCYSARSYAHWNRFRQREGSQVNHADRVALAVGHVGILAICGTIVRQSLLAEIPPGKAAQHGQHNYDDEKFSQNGDHSCGRKRLSETQKGSAIPTVAAGQPPRKSIFVRKQAASARFGRLPPLRCASNEERTA